MGVPDLVKESFLFLTLLRGQHREEVSFRLDSHELQVGFDRFALFELGLDDGEVRLLVPDERSQLPLRHHDIRVRPNPHAVLVKRESSELGDLLVRQTDFFLMSEEMTKNV